MRVTEQVNCADDAESVEFEYTLHNAVDKSTVTVTATTSAEWITSIDTSEIGKVRFTAEQNDGTSRSPDRLTISSLVRFVSFRRLHAILSLKFLT